MIARPQRRPPSICSFAPLILTLLLAAALRFHQLGRQSFWNDEGNTARLVERPIPLIIEGAAGDIHPPGYYLGLHFWRAIAGESEFALRAYSALCGVLTVAVVGAVSRLALDKDEASGPANSAKAGTAVYGAVVLAALHPLGVTYGQEARMYAQLSLGAALTLWAAASLVARRERLSRGTVLALAGAIALGLYTHYAYILALMGLNVAFGLYWLARHLLHARRGARGGELSLLATWVLAHALGGLAFLPWAPIALGARGWRPPDLVPGEAAGAMVQTLLAGTTLPEPIASLPLAAAALLILLAMAASIRRSRRVASRFAIWAALGMALVPAGLIAGAGLYRPAYLKFLMVSVAPLSVVLAVPLSGWWGCCIGPSGARLPARRLSQAIALVLWLSLLPTAASSLHHLYNNPAYERDDYRGIATLIRAEGRAGDAILLSAPNQWEVFTYYYREGSGDALPVYPAPYRPHREEAERWVDGILRAHAGGRLFALYWGDLESDPERHIERALAQRAFKAGDAWITSVRLARYGTGPLVTAPTIETDTVLGDLDAGEQIRLIGHHLPHSVWQPGEILPLTLFWRAEHSVGEPLKVFVHLVDAQGALAAQTDMEPHGGFLPTWAWLPEDVVVDRYGVLLPDDLATGSYSLHVGMYRYSGGRLPVTVNGAVLGDYVALGPVTVGGDR